VPARLEGRGGQPEGSCHRQMLDAVSGSLGGVNLFAYARSCLHACGFELLRRA